MIEQRVTLRYGAQQIPAIVQAVQGDTGRDVIFELADYEIPAGATANYYIDKPDGNAVYNSAEVISSTEILAHLTEQALAAPGRNNGQVRILSDGEVITSFDFVLEVEVFRGLMRMQSETEVNIFDEALQAAAEEAIQEILDQTPVVTGMQNSIAPSYSASSTYAVGDYVMYNAQLYKCNTAITTAEAWTAAHWTQVPLADDVSELKSAQNNETVSIRKGYINSKYPCILGGSTLWSASSEGHIMIPVEPGDTVTIYANRNQDSYYGVLREFQVPNAADTVKYSAGAGFTGRLETTKNTSDSYTMPSDAAYLAVNLGYSGLNFTPSKILINGVDALTENLSNVYEKIDDLKEDKNAIIEQIIKNNCYDYIFDAAFGIRKTDSFGGVDFVWSGNSVKIDGTASGAQSSNCIVSPSSLLGMEKGKTYRFVNNCSDSRVAFTLFVTTDNGSNWTRVAYIYGKEYDYTIPNNITGFLFRVDVGNGDTLDCTATLHAYNTLANDEIESILKRALLSEVLDLPNNTDWHTIKTNSVWLVDGSKTYTNAPPLSSKTGFLFSFNVANGAWYLHLFIPFSVVGIYRERGDDLSWSEWVDIASSGTATYNNYYTFNNYTNENTISCSPSFTTDTNAYLASSGSSDRTADILSVLTSNGICRLGKGIYYITDLVMPDDTTIEGCGDGTLIILTENANFGIKMGSNCILEKFNMVGKLATITPQSTVRSKHGILWQGDYTQSESSLTQPKRSIIDKVFLAHFEGGAITCYDTGYGTYNHLEVTNCYIWDCDAGINVSYFSEFHKFTNVRANECYYGCVNNGGNNVFVNCDFSTNKVGFLMDNSAEQSPNNSHGSAVACVFNHTDSNAGIGIKILNCDNGFIFDGCQIFFSQIYADDSEGIVFSNCNFGSDNIVFTISGGGTILFANNMHQGTPTINITNNNKVHFANCYNRTSGAAIGN